MNAQTAQGALPQATAEFCTFAAHGIHALGRLDDNFGQALLWYEALVRPRGAYREWAPSDFIDLLYRERLPVYTDLEVFQRVASWQLEQEQPMRVSINTHPESLISSRFVELVLGYQGRARQLGHSICLELVEFGSSREKSSLVANAQRLRQAGVLVALDDFGCRINCFDLCAAGIVDLLKVDRDVTGGVHLDSNRRAVVESIATLGRGLGARVIAEGVETPAQVKALKSLGMHYGQGYHFQKPQTLEI